MSRRNALLAALVSLLLLAPRETVGQTWVLNSSAHWRNGTSEGVVIEDSRLRLSDKEAGQWASSWHDWGLSLSVAEIEVRASVNAFANKSIDVIVAGREQSYTDRVKVPHDWYGRCMIAILDENRWVMAIRSGVDHYRGQDRDAIHVLTSDDEGRTWGGLNRWFDGTAIEGMPFDDGHIHSEPGIYRMPNGDLILQFWRSGIKSGTRQLRSEDNGKTWRPDIDQVNIEGLTGADGSLALGTQDYFVDPENPTDTYMAFQFFRYNSMSGSLLARSQDNGASYEFVSWIGPLASVDEPDSGATFEPGIEYLGNRTIIAVMRDGAGNGRTWQSVSRDMGASFSPLVDIAGQVNAGIDGGHWKRPRLYKESNPYLQFNNDLNYETGQGRLWGFGSHSNSGGPTRKPAVFWSDDNGKSWSGPELLHGSLGEGTFTGVGDLKRRLDNTFVAVSNYATRDSQLSDVEQYTFGGARIRLRVDVDGNADGKPDATSDLHEVHDGDNTIRVHLPPNERWRLVLQFAAIDTAGRPEIVGITINPL